MKIDLEKIRNNPQAVYGIGVVLGLTLGYALWGMQEPKVIVRNSPSPYLVPTFADDTVSKRPCNCKEMKDDGRGNRTVHQDTSPHNGDGNVGGHAVLFGGRLDGTSQARHIEVGDVPGVTDVNPDSEI